MNEIPHISNGTRARDGSSTPSPNTVQKIKLACLRIFSNLFFLRFVTGSFT